MKYKPRLQKESIQAVHDRAMGMGDDDPLKPDYSRFLRTAQKSSFSNAVPLHHGHLENYSHWRDIVQLNAVTKIQNIFRGKLARKAAETIAKKYAFSCAKAMALEDTRQRIASEIWKVRCCTPPPRPSFSIFRRLQFIDNHPLIALRDRLSPTARTTARGIVRRGTSQMGCASTDEASQTSSSW